MFPALGGAPGQPGLTWVALQSGGLGSIVGVQAPTHSMQTAALHLELEQMRRREEALLQVMVAAPGQQNGPIPALTAPSRAMALDSNAMRNTLNHGSNGIARRTSNATGRTNGRGAAASNSGDADGVTTGSKGGRMSRWRRDKSKMEGLQQQVEEKRAEAERVAMDNFQLRKRAEALEHAVEAHEVQMALLNRSMQCPSSEARAQLANKYRKFVSEASLAMLNLSEDGDAPSDSPALARITDLVSDFKKVCASIYIQHPGIQFTLVATHLDAPDDQTYPPPPDDHWRQVASKIGATLQQLDEIAASWDLTEEAMAKMRAEAQTLSFKLEQGLAGSTSQSCDLMEVGQQLSALTFKQAMAYFSFSYAVCARIFTPLQLARGMVHSFPYYLCSRRLVAQLLRLRRSSQDIAGSGPLPLFARQS